MLTELVEATGTVTCPCVSRHVPRPVVLHNHHIIPLSYGGPNTAENKILICPTAHYNIHKLLWHYNKNDGLPPGSVRKHFSDFVQEYAARGWAGRTRWAIEEGELSGVAPLNTDYVDSCPK